MASVRILHSGNLVRNVYAGDMEKYYDPEKYMFCQRRRKSFCSLKGRRWMGRRKMNQEIFDLKPLTKEEVAWLEEHFIDFAREQYLVRWDYSVRRNSRDRIKKRRGEIRELTKNRKVACRSGLDNPPLIPRH